MFCCRDFGTSLLQINDFLEEVVAGASHFYTSKQGESGASYTTKEKEHGVVMVASGYQGNEIQDSRNYRKALGR